MIQQLDTNSLENYTNLSIDHNQLVELLDQLELDNNLLTALPMGIFNVFSQLREVNPYNNPLHWDCELSWLPDFLRNVNLLLVLALIK